METADDGTHESQVQANAYLGFAQFLELSCTLYYRAANEKK